MRPDLLRGEACQIGKRLEKLGAAERDLKQDAVGPDKCSAKIIHNDRQRVGFSQRQNPVVVERLLQAIASRCWVQP